MWADNETAVDLLGFKVHVDLILDVIKDDSILPVSIGIFGDWGSGKSSILQIIYNELKGTGDDLKDDTLVIYFNGWTFEGYDDAKAALLESIIQKFEQNKKLSAKIKTETTKLLKSVNWMRVLSLGFKKIALPTAAAYFSGGLSLIPFMTSEFGKISGDDLVKKLQGEDAGKFLEEIMKKKKDDDDDHAAIREFRTDFKKMLDQSNIKKLVVIIDDLDRCTHERIIENLEAIKLFLNVEKTAFIIGADPRIVRHAIEHRYSREYLAARNPANDDTNQRIVTDYLEKLIQIPYNLPRLTDHEVETYMSLLYAQRFMPKSFVAIQQEFERFRQQNRYEVFGFANIEKLVETDERGQLASGAILVISLASIITEGLKGNPRQIKRFLNAFTLRQKLANVAHFHEFRIDVLAKLMVLEYSYDDLFKELFEWQATEAGQPEQLKKAEDQAKVKNAVKLENASTRWSEPQVVRWLNTAPSLAQVDLRDYFWLTRDRLFASISGSSLISPLVRSLTRSLLEAGSATIRNARAVEVSKLGTSDLSHLFTLLEKEIIAHPEESNFHKIYLALIEQPFDPAIDAYEKALRRMDQDKIPFPLHNEFKKALTTNPKLATVVASITPDTKFGKALNQQ